jgi:hypothetical protein
MPGRPSLASERRGQRRVIVVFDVDLKFTIRRVL